MKKITKELRELEIDVLNSRIKELETKLFNFNFQKKVGSLENPSSIRIAKKDIARIKTTLTFKEKGAGKK